MAPLKPLIRLQEAALDVVNKYCSDSVVNYLEKCDGPEVNRDIALIKAEVCSNIPRILFNDFAVLFLQRISDNGSKRIKQWIEKSGAAIVDVVIDNRLTKLESYPGVAEQLMHVLYNNLVPLENLKHLHLGKGRAEFLSNLSQCNLKYLTTFGCHRVCTDDILILLSERCPNLTTLDIEESKSITSLGLDALKRCRGLRVLKLKNCGVSSEYFIAHILSNDSIENHTHFVYDLENIMAFANGVYHGLKSFHTNNVEITNEVLKVIVTSLPNLDSLDFYGNRATGNLSLLRSLSRLTSLGIWCHHGYSMDEVELLLSEVGDKILDLSILVDSTQAQHVINLVYKSCKDIESLKVGIWSGYGSQRITVPPFDKLKTLNVDIYHSWESVELYFSRLVSLEKLYLNSCSADVETILLSNDKFPYISEIKESYSESEKRNAILKIIRDNNLNVRYYEGF